MAHSNSDTSSRCSDGLVCRTTTESKQDTNNSPSGSYSNIPGEYRNSFTPAFGLFSLGSTSPSASPTFRFTFQSSDKPSTIASSAVPPPATALSAVPVKPSLIRFQHASPPSNSVLSLSGPAMDRPDQEEEARDHLHLIPGLSSTATDTQVDATIEDIKTTPLFTHQVRKAVANGIGPFAGCSGHLFQQYGLLGIRERTYNSRYPDVSGTLSGEQNLVYANMNAPWSAFICGSQGAGKSHSLSCLLENSLLTSLPAGKNPKPLAGLVFHYDKFTSHGSTQLCEAAYLCSAGIPVRVLVSPSNFHAMRRLYRNLPGLPERAPRPEIISLYFQEQQLNVSRLMTLMAVNGENGVPLYMHVLFKILREMSVETGGTGGVDYLDFKQRLEGQGFIATQQAPLAIRLALLESFLAHKQQSEPATAHMKLMFNSAPGTLTIIDLSCPFVNEQDACALFTIRLSIFMENRCDCGRVIALDEAHKFLTSSGEAKELTEQLTSIVRQQRHLATRVIVATQEPTLAPSLLDLCNVSIVHRFNSPAWFQVLRQHLAGARLRTDHSDEKLFEMIVGLRTGEALVFRPSGILDTAGQEVYRLNDGFIRARIRGRVAADGGRSILTSDEMRKLETETIPAQELIVPFCGAVRPSDIAAKPAQSTAGTEYDESEGESSSEGTYDRASASSSASSCHLPAVQMPRRTATSKPANTKPAIMKPTVASQKPNVARTAPGSKPIPTKNRAAFSKNTATPYVQDAVTESLKAKPLSIQYEVVRNQAARSADLPEGFFRSKKEWSRWSRRIIRAQVKKHVTDHSIAPPACH